MTRKMWHRVICALTTLSLCMALLGIDALHALVAYALPTNTIPVGGVLFEGADTQASEWKTLQFSPGEVNDSTVPHESGYEFVSAYVPNPNKPKDIFPISKLELNEQGDKVIITPADTQQNPNVKLYVPTSQSAQKIKFLYINSASWVKVSYTNNTIDSKGIIAGPKEIQVNGETATGYFTVSVPRNQIPSNPQATNDAEISFNKDLSTAERTVYQYKVVTKKDTNITLSSTMRSTLTISASDFKPNDWKLGVAAGKYADTLVKLPDNTSFKQGDTVTFNVYHDKVIPSKITYSVFLAALHINGEIFGAPQPFGRYGASKYNNDSIITIPGYLNRDDPGSKGNAGYRFLLEHTPWATTSFSAFQGYDPYWQNDPTSNDPAGVRAWWVNQVAKKVIGEETVRQVKSGSLAGATVKIKILDAIPYMNTRQLGEYAPGQAADTSTFTRGALMPDGSVQRPMKDNGYGMSLRMAYQVTIENAPSSMNIDTEWAASNNFKVGLYLNRGVEDVQVYASGLEYQSKPNPNGLGWISTNHTWLDGVALEGTTMDPANQGHGEGYGSFRVLGNNDPHLQIRGNVINGYKNPAYVDAAEAPKQAGIPNMSLANTSVDGYGWKGKFPLFAVGFDWITDMNWYYWRQTNPVNCYGGMNIVGVRADLMNIPAGYDLEGVSLPNNEGTLFPSMETASANTVDASVYKYNVESNPIIQIPIATLTKTSNGSAQELLYWNLYRKHGGELTKVDKAYAPGASIDIRNPENVGGRLSDVQGNALVDGFVLKPVFSGEATISNDHYTVRKEFYKNENLVKTEDVEDFAAVPGLYAEISDSVASKTAELSGESYTLKNKPENMTVLLGNDKTVMTLRYDLSSDSDRYTASTDSLTTPLGTTPNEDTLKSVIKVTEGNSQEKKSLPVGSHVEIESGFDPNVPGEQQVQVKITYPDGSTTTVEVPVTVKDNRTDAQKWQADHSTLQLTGVPATFDWGHVVTNQDIKNMVQQNGQLPSDVTYSIDPQINTKPTDVSGRTQNTTVTVTFSDNSKMTVEVPVTIKSAADTFSPQTKAVNAAKGEALGTEAAKSAIANADQMPEGTTYAFKDPVDTNTTGDKSATVVVTYPDGTTTELPVTVKVTNLADKWISKYGALEGDTKTFQYGSKPTDAEKLGLVKHSEELVNDIANVVYDKPLDTAPTTLEGHEQDIKVTVTFKDGSTLSTPEGKFAHATITDLSSNIEVSANKPVQVDLNQQPSEQALKDALKIADNKNLPEGTVVTLKDGPVDTATTGDKNVTIHVAYPDGSSVDIPATVKVVDNSDAAHYQPEVGPVTADFGGQVPDLTKAITNMADLPAGTKVVADTSNIDTKRPGEQRGTVTVTYPDGSKETIEVPVTVKSANDTFTPEANPLEVNLGQELSQDDAKAAIQNASSLPENTKFEFVSAPDTSAPGEQQVQVKITYPDGSTTTVEVPVTVKDNRTDAQKWQADHSTLQLTGVPATFDWGHVVTNQDIKNMVQQNGQLPSDVTYSIDPQINTKPTDVSGRTQNPTVTVTFSDNSKMTVEVPVTIKSAADTYDLSSHGIDVNIFKQPTLEQLKEALVDKDHMALPEGTQVAIKGGLIDTNTTGEKSFIIVVTYPDGSTAEVPAKINVVDNRDSARYKPQTEPVEVGYGKKVPNLESGLINKADLPTGTTYTSDISGIDTTKPGAYTGTLTITYPDGSTVKIEVPIVVKSASDTFKPKAEAPISVDLGRKLTDEDAKSAVNTDGLPEGTTYHFKDPVDTASAGSKDAVVVITYPDGSTTEVSVKVQVRTEADTYLHNYGKSGKLETKETTFSWGQEIDQDALKNLLVNASNLPAGVILTTEPVINTEPTTKVGHIQEVKLVITFADGSRVESTVVVKISDKPVLASQSAKNTSTKVMSKAGFNKRVTTPVTGDPTSLGVIVATLAGGFAFISAGFKRRKK